jgi:hypothetical protein
VTSINPLRAAPPPSLRPTPGIPQPSAPVAMPPAPNPSLRIEPVLGVVVIEVRDAAGEVVRSVPTERELRAYRVAALRGGEPNASGEDAQPAGRQPQSDEQVGPGGLLPRA